MDERLAYVALNMMTGVGPVGVRTLVAGLGSAAAILEASEAQLASVPDAGRDLVRLIVEGRRKVDPEAELSRAEELGIQLVTFVDAGYPKRLREIRDPPLALYVQGDLVAKDQHAVSVVGSRHTTHYGLAVAERLGYQLAQAGYTVVSGLARGIDTAAHRGALKGQGRTIAVLGGALDRMYPPENAELARSIAGQGAVMSEYALGREPDRTTFPVRNRIVSGFSMGVVVVEAGLESGAMTTAQQAAEQGRTVFAVPGRVDTPSARGCHRLLKDGARLVEGVEDILEEFSFLLRPETGSALRGASTQAAAAGPMPTLSPEEEAVWRIVEEEDRVDIDALTRRTELRTAQVLAALVGLEMKKLVRVLPGRSVERRRD